MIQSCPHCLKAIPKGFELDIYRMVKVDPTGVNRLGTIFCKHTHKSIDQALRRLFKAGLLERSSDGHEFIYSVKV